MNYKWRFIVESQEVFSFRAALWIRQWLCLCEVFWDLSYNSTFLSFPPSSVMILLAFLSCFLSSSLSDCSWVWLLSYKKIRSEYHIQLTVWTLNCCECPQNTRQFSQTSRFIFSLVQCTLISSRIIDRSE